MEALLARINLDGRQEAAMKADFVKAIRYYEDQGLSPDEIRKRLDPANLGYFYYEEPDAWYRLDNAAKIYPVSMRRTWLPMFRLSALSDMSFLTVMLEATPPAIYTFPALYLSARSRAAP